MNKPGKEEMEGGGSLPRLILIYPADPVARNVCRHLLELYPFRSCGRGYRCGEFVLLPVERDPLQMDSLPLPASEVLIPYRHASASGLPTLSVHVPGEPERKKLALAKPETVGTLLRSLQLVKEERDLPHLVSLEATHHGPADLEVPATFVEIGSGKEEWEKKAAGEAVARALLSPSGECSRALGVGGPHYAPHHTEVVLKTKYWIGHLLPKYMTLTVELLEEAARRTVGRVGLILSDEEGLNSEQKKRVNEISAKLGISKLTVKQALSQKL